ITHLRSLGIGCNQYFSPIHLQPFYQKEYGWKRGDLPVTEYMGDHSMSIPFFNKLKEEDQKIVVSEIKKWLKENPA
ncbi:DegT/DnrJ/EryC1/StrS family aminotransferase, partial [bacterium]|nr:DegT/DnrJ/EryC1/StrS family aminotransferase [bacterium]